MTNYSHRPVRSGGLSISESPDPKSIGHTCSNSASAGWPCNTSNINPIDLCYSHLSTIDVSGKQSLENRSDKTKSRSGPRKMHCCRFPIYFDVNCLYTCAFKPRCLPDRCTRATMIEKLPRGVCT